MNLGIRGRRAAVAAGSAGLGLATARALAEEGVAVAICGRHQDRLDEAVAAIGEGAVGIVADMSVQGDATRFAETAADRLGGPLDIVVANAGGPPPGEASTTPLAAFEEALHLNFLSTVELCNATVEAMRSAGWGRILAITSIGARQPIPSLAASSAARAAVTSYAKNLATELVGTGVCVNTIQPGSHNTARMAHLSGVPEHGPAPRLGDPADFGRIAAFLCSEPVAFVSGSAILVDGGVSRALQ